jgi:rhodanese-related sulfurtransferase
VSLPDAINIPHDQVVARKSELDINRVHILFCNGPQCPQTPDALGALTEDGYPPDRLAYYRGGMHDWITLGMPTQPV